MFFLCIYLDEGSGCTNVCICIRTHSQPFVQNRLMIFYKTGRDEVLMIRMCLGFSTKQNRSTEGCSKLKGP